MHIVPYLENETNRAESSSYSHERGVIYGDSCKGSVGSQRDEVKRLCRRLDILEKDTQLLKKIFFVKMEERNELFNEISQYLHTVQENIRISKAKEKALKVTSIVNASKGQGPIMEAGILQALHRDRDTTVVRNRKVNVIALQDHGDPPKNHCQSS